MAQKSDVSKSMCTSYNDKQIRYLTAISTDETRNVILISHSCTSLAFSNDCILTFITNTWTKKKKKKKKITYNIRAWVSFNNLLNYYSISYNKMTRNRSQQSVFSGPWSLKIYKRSSNREHSYSARARFLLFRRIVTFFFLILRL